MSAPADHEFPRWGYISSSGLEAASASGVEAAGGAEPLELSFHTSDSTLDGSTGSISAMAGRQLSSKSSSGSVMTVVQQLITVTDSGSSISSFHANQLHSSQRVDDSFHGDCRFPRKAGSSADESVHALGPRDTDRSTLTSTSDDQSMAIAVGTAIDPAVQLPKSSSAAPPAAAVAEFHKNWSSPAEDFSQQSASSRSSQQPRLQAAHSVRFAPDAIGGIRRPRGDCRSDDLRRLAAMARFPVWRESAGTNVANASNTTAQSQARPASTGAPAAATATAAKEDRNEAESSPSCLSKCSVLRCLGLIAYYLTLWSVGASFTWLLLEVSLMHTSRGSFPYYMSPHSFCLSSPGIGFPGGNPEPGKVTEFDGLAGLNDSLGSKLRSQFLELEASKMRQCDSESAETVDSDLLMQPCNLTAFAQAAIRQVDALLKDRPAVLVQIKRHLGYLPVTGSHVTISCEATVSDSSIALRYYSWNGTELVESDNAGTVPTVYFPMLSRWHNAPAVLVSLKNTESSVWTGKQLKIRCQASDGGDVKPPEREIILKIGYF